MKPQSKNHQFQVLKVFAVLFTFALALLGAQSLEKQSRAVEHIKFLKCVSKGVSEIKCSFKVAFTGE